MSTVFTNDPGLNNVWSQDIDKGNAKPIRISLYDLSQVKKRSDAEAQYIARDRYHYTIHMFIVIPYCA